MDIIEFFDHDALELPRARVTGDFGTFLEQILDEYLSVAGALKGADFLTRGFRAAVREVKYLSKALGRAVNHYLDGFPNRAYDVLKRTLPKVRANLEKLASIADVAPALQYLYRIRLDEPGLIAPYTRKDLFHIPFDNVHKVSTNRYSIPGLPSLYFGGSVWGCWEEFGRPAFDRMQLVRYRAVAPVQVLDFGYRPALIASLLHANWNTVRHGGQLAEFCLAQALCWPILAGCSIRVLNPGASFVPEYILPQMMLQWVRHQTPWHGVRYFSSKVGQYVDDPSAATNYVFPARARTAKGHCAELSRQFELSEPMSWSVLQHGGITGASSRRPPNWKLRFVEGVEVAYLHTEFWRCEDKLNAMPTGAL